MRGCILDKQSFDRGDIALAPLIDQLDHWQHYPSSLPHQVLERVADCDVIITNKVPVRREVIEQSSRLKLIMLAATGTDNVDLSACQERGIVVCNARQYANAAVIQHTFTLILNLMTNITKYHQDVMNGQWSKSDIFCLLDHPIRELESKTLGIIGNGNLGSAVASVGEAFGMNIVVCQRPKSAPTEGRLAFEEFLSVSDIVSIHCPLNDDTHHMISSAAFAAMKPEAMIINTARGAIIDSNALVTALKKGEIAGAGIDVFDQEPPPADHPLLQKNIPNLIVTPHNAWGTRESRQRLVMQMAENLSAWLSGTPKNRVT